MDLAPVVTTSGLAFDRAYSFAWRTVTLCYRSCFS